MSEGRPDRQAAATLIRTLLSGGSPNSEPPEAFGEYRDVVELLVIAHAHGETPKVRELWLDLARRHPELAEVVSGEPATSEGWQLFTLADAYQPRSSLIYVVRGLFPLPSLSIVYGAPGTIKSLLLADMAISVAAGLPWLPPLPQASGAAKITQQVGVLWCDFDNGPRTTHERFEALGRARDLPATIPLSYVSMPSPWLDAGHADAMRALAQRIHALNAKLMIIDNLTTIKGVADENSAQMANVMANFRRLTEDTGAAVILLHHQRKDSHQRSGSDTAGRAGDRLRGHSSIEAAVDLALLVERPPHADAVTLQGTKVRGVDVSPFGAQFTYDHKPGTSELATAKFYGLAVEDRVSDCAIGEAVMAIVKANPLMNQRDLKTKVKEDLPAVGMHRIGGVIARLERKKKLKTKPGERGAKLYEVG
jgi:hypothetical protein